MELTGDEPRLIARRAPGVRVVVGADRVATARQASASGANFLILDDGFQHRRLARDVDLVVVGGEGNGRLMPAGPLRESRAALTRAHLLWNPDPDAAGDAKTIVARHRISGVVGKGGAIEPPESLRGRSVVALAGIARPARFLASLESLGATVVERFLLPDHHAFSEPELARVREAAARHGAAVVTTEKDRERLPAGFEALAPRLGVEVVRGLDTLASVLGLPVGTALSASE